MRAMDQARTRPPITGVLGIFVGLAGTTAGLTTLFLGMRRVMEIGGFCAEGGPFVIQHRCPEGSVPLILGGIWGGLVMAGVYAWQTTKHRAPSLLVLLWPALFLSLGWNFLEFGLDPPGGEGLAWGWLVCAVVFGLMGGAPLAFMVSAVLQPSKRPPRPGAGLLPGRRRTPAADVVQVVDDLAGEGGERPDVVSRLERLDELRRSGAIDDAEYEQAKRLVLEGEA